MKIYVRRSRDHQSRGPENVHVEAGGSVSLTTGNLRGMGEGYIPFGRLNTWTLDPGAHIEIDVTLKGEQGWTFDATQLEGVNVTEVDWRAEPPHYG
jgi:hypothetical protein